MSVIEQILGGPLRPALGVLITGYFLGCFTTGYYLVRWRCGVDVRETGSGNVGARNVGRLLGPTGFFLTLIGDFAKGCLAVWVAMAWTNNHRLALVALLAVVVGHIWPIQLNFRGGKGVAASLGALAIYNFPLALVLAVLSAAGSALARRTVLGGLMAYALLPLGSFFLKQDAAQICGMSVLAALVLLAHHKNIAEEFSQLTAARNVGQQQESPQSKN